MTNLDSSAAWSSATRMVAANRDVLAPIAGVFFFLPSLAGAIFVPAPPVKSGMTEMQIVEAMQAHYADSFPLLLLLSLIPMAGMLTMLVAMLDGRRPTVGEAIRRSIGLLPSYFAAQLLVAIAITPVLFLLLAVLAAALPPAVAVAIAMAALLWPVMRTILVGGIMASGGQRGPVDAIRASLRLTRGNSGRILAFIALASLVFLVIYGLVMMIVGVVLMLVSGGEPQRIIGEAISGVLTSGAYTYFVAILAAIFEQLTSQGPGAASTFD